MRITDIEEKLANLEKITMKSTKIRKSLNFKIKLRLKLNHVKSIEKKSAKRQSFHMHACIKEQIYINVTTATKSLRIKLN